MYNSFLFSLCPLIPGTIRMEPLGHDQKGTLGGAGIGFRFYQLGLAGCRRKAEFKLQDVINVYSAYGGPTWTSIVGTLSLALSSACVRRGIGILIEHPSLPNKAGGRSA